MVDHCNAAGNFTVYIANFSHVSIVVVVIDNRCVYSGVCNIDIGHVSATHAIGRDEHFTRSKREPAHIESDAKVRSAYPRHQRRRIHRSHINNVRWRWRSRNPAPGSVYEHPAAIVEWREAPGSIVDPGITPGSNVSPVAVVIRGPAYDGGVRKPDHAI